MRFKLSLIFLSLMVSIAVAAQTTQAPATADVGDSTTETPKAMHPVEDQKPKRPNYDDPSLSESHPLYDWSKHKDEVEVKDHPLADKGLVEITRDKTYIYKVDTHEGNHAGSLIIGYMNPQNLKNPQTGTTFNQDYGGGNALISFNYEWQVLRMPIGRLGLTAGFGLFTAQGHGQFTHPSLEPSGLQPLETFTLVMIPIEAGAVYRFQFWNRQLLMPYGGGGLSLMPFTEIRDDGIAPKYAGSIAAYASAGAAINMTYFDKFAQLTLSREYGINRVYLTAEIREYVTLASHYDFGGMVPAGGFIAEF